MITPTTELLKEAIEDTDELIEYVLSSFSLIYGLISPATRA